MTAQQLDNATEPNGAFSVWWDEPADEDLENPMSWSSRRKWGIIGILSFLTFLT